MGIYSVIGQRGKLLDTKGASILAAFEDGEPATVERKIGKGRAVHFAWFPGLSYQYARDGESKSFSPVLRNMITEPVYTAGAVPPVTVSQPLIEAPMLLSEKGVAVTVLNWTGEAQKQVYLTVRIPFTARTVESVKQGKLAFTQTEKGLRCSLPLDAVDVVVIKP